MTSAQISALTSGCSVGDTIDLLVDAAESLDNADEITVTMRGIVGYVTDVLYEPEQAEQNIVKRMPLSDLPHTVARWQEMGRAITSVAAYER